MHHTGILNLANQLYGGAVVDTGRILQSAQWGKCERLGGRRAASADPVQLRKLDRTFQSPVIRAGVVRGMQIGTLSTDSCTIRSRCFRLASSLRAPAARVRTTGTWRGDFMSQSEQSLKLLTAAATSGGISRRAFIEGAVALGATVQGALTLWSREVAAAVPSKGGRFRVGLDDGNTTDGMDPATFASRFMITMAHTHRNFLTEIAPDNKVIGELAESWDVTPDAKKWTFKLRKGVEFHNGKSFDANDAAASLNYHRAEDSKSGAKALFAVGGEYQGGRPAYARRRAG